MAYTKPKYEGNDFLEWYKSNFGVDYSGGGLSRREGMSDIDWDIGNELYSAYQQQQARQEQYDSDYSSLLQQYNKTVNSANSQYEAAKASQEASHAKNTADLLANYQSSVGDLDTRRKNALQGASITYDKLKKYLPTQVKAQGLGGLGVSESTLLQAHNTYNTQRGSIENSYNANKATLENAYTTNKSSLDTAHGETLRQLEADKLASDTARDNAYSSDTTSLLNRYNADMQSIKDGVNVGAITADYQEKNRVLQQGNYDDLASLLSMSDSETLSDYYARIEAADINDQQKALLKTLAENQVQGNIAKRQQNTFANFQSTIKQLTDTSTEAAFAKIDSLDISDQQKAQLKTLVESQVSQNVYNYKQEMRSEALTRYDDALYGEDYAEAKKILDGYKQYLSDDEYNTRLNTINDKVAAQTEAEAKAKAEEAAEKDKRIVSGQETFEYNGGTYQISSQLKSDANEIQRNNDFKDQLKSKCGTTDPYDSSKIPNGTTFEIKADNRGSNDFNFWDDVGAFLLSPLGAGAWDSWWNWNTVYVTFYNGNWYKSEKKV